MATTARTSRSKSSRPKPSSTRSSSNSKRTSPTKSGKRSTTLPSHRWSAKVKTDSTKPAPGLFKKSAKEIAEGLSKKSVSPRGLGQAMQMLSFYENRGGKNLSADRLQALENAKEIIRHKEGKNSSKDTTRAKSHTKTSEKKTTSMRRPRAGSHSRRSS